ncbi:BlaI/MecI/CopY family transcriptional regulator [Aureliella helgolandensis]|uniref:Methicillin resistance regulatory protein MecI n=1 Tax=Aureliella helgolandensis TaxID=2527968 RepID=A0A518GAT6_9BACT|nr:BlaI/MecI/CopY family transcriptional regulator [Aureliella helgolandensis]QDV25718.1 Methicillin resistance regulatory protein MecI [Aureliella helgolandensis]
MARPKAVELTARELAVMQLFWNNGEGTAEQAQTHLEATGEKLAYTTVANVVRSLADKGFLKLTNSTRPYQYVAVRKFEDVSKRIVGDLVNRLFAGSRQAMLVQLLDRKKLTKPEREYLESLLNEQEQ